jgi:hypothetical protein
MDPRLLRPAIAKREHAPRHTQVDFTSRLLVSELDGAPIPRADIITICYTAMLAGLDTTCSALGFIFHHLAGDTSCGTGSPPGLSCGPGQWRSSSASTRWSSWTAAWSRATSTFTACTAHAQGRDRLAGPGERQPRSGEVRRPHSFDIDREDLNHHLAAAVEEYGVLSGPDLDEPTESLLSDEVVAVFPLAWISGQWLWAVPSALQPAAAPTAAAAAPRNVRRRSPSPLTFVPAGRSDAASKRGNRRCMRRHPGRVRAGVPRAGQESATPRTLAVKPRMLPTTPSTSFTPCCSNIWS